MNPTKLTEERGTTHGSFSENARISQGLKTIMTGYRPDGSITKYTAIQKEAIDMICLKLSRIASGHADFRDHWADVSGYAHLVVQSIDEQNAKNNNSNREE